MLLHQRLLGNADARSGDDRFAARAALRVIDEHRAAYGVEPIRRVLPIAPSPTTPTPRDAPVKHLGK